MLRVQKQYLYEKELSESADERYLLMNTGNNATTDKIFRTHFWSTFCSFDISTRLIILDRRRHLFTCQILVYFSFILSHFNFFVTYQRSWFFSIRFFSFILFLWCYGRWADEALICHREGGVRIGDVLFLSIFFSSLIIYRELEPHIGLFFSFCVLGIF